MTAQGDYHFAPRFVELLAHADFNRSMLDLSRQQLLDDLTIRLAQLRHVAREPSYPHAPDDIDESLAANVNKLSRCDLLAIRALLSHLPDAELSHTLYHMGLDDLADTTSEHGGLLHLKPTQDGITVTIYPPLLANNDTRYVPTMKLYAQGACALAFFHFHFQQLDNQAKAGPGEGDIKSAAQNLYTGVVITAVGKNYFNVDYFNPDGAVVDLGVYHANN